VAYTPTAALVALASVGMVGPVSWAIGTDGDRHAVPAQAVDAAAADIPGAFEAEQIEGSAEVHEERVVLWPAKTFAVLEQWMAGATSDCSPASSGA
jgi:hypothetical protein